MRDISVEESEELPQILHSLVRDGPAAAAGHSAMRTASGEGGEGADEADRQILTEAIRAAAPALAKLQVGSMFSYSWPSNCRAEAGTKLYPSPC